MLLKPMSAILDEAVLETTLAAEHNVLDGGFLLCWLKWSDGRTYTTIANDYTAFTVKQYGKATVVFDGYSGGPSTKDNTHQRWGQNHDGHKVNITETTTFTAKMEDFLSNNENKQTLIHMIADHLQIKGCHVIHAKRDADLDIVRTAVLMSSEKTTTLIGEDTDLLVLLLHYASPNDGTKVYFCSDKGRPTVVYDIKVIQQVLGSEICQSLMFLHAFTGCDTTSRIFGIGKQSALQMLIKGDPVLQSCAKIFSTPGQDMDVILDSGCVLMVSLFNGKPGNKLPALRYTHLCKKSDCGEKLCDTQTIASNIFGYKVSFSENLSPGNAMDGQG